MAGQVARPKTAPNAFKNRSVDSAVATAFKAGDLRVTVFNGMKSIGGSSLIFGEGLHRSRVEIYAGDTKVTESLVERGSVDTEFSWSGFESVFKTLAVTSPNLRLVVFDCNRAHERQPLGQSRLSLYDVTPFVENFKIVLPIESRIDLQNFDSSKKTVVGVLTLLVTYEPYVVVSMAPNQIEKIKIAKMRKMRLGFGWSSIRDDLDITDGVGASVVMFDRLGGFIDAVDIRRPRSRRGPRLRYRNVRYSQDEADIGAEDVEEVLLDVRDPMQQRALCYFLVLCARDRATYLDDLATSYFRVVDGDSGLGKCKYSPSEGAAKSTACILGRIHKDPLDDKVIIA
jgi:hypothetical protein